MDPIEDAAKALYAALRNKDQNALLAMFGPDLKRVQEADPAQRAATRARLAQLFKENWSLSTAFDGSRIIRLGYEGWSFPVPLTKSQSKWQFNTPAGIEEIANRTVGRNEIVTMETFSLLNDCQAAFKAKNGKFTDKIVSTTGSQDGLYWPANGGEKSFLAQRIGDTANFTTKRIKGAPWFGYYYNLNLTSDGYVVSAWPANYGQSGVMSFWTDASGRIYEKDLGSHGGSFLRSFDATSNPQGWKVVSP